MIWGNFIGLALLGSALIAICMFLSALTESQVIAAVTGFVVGLFLMLVDALALVVNSSLLQTLFRQLSFKGRYRPLPWACWSCPMSSFSSASARCSCS